MPDVKSVGGAAQSMQAPATHDRDHDPKRIADAARIVSLERLALSPQCGFASTMEGNKLTQDEQRAKLDLVGRVARSVFG